MIVVGGPQQFSMYCWKVGLGVYALFCELGRATQQANVLYAAFDIWNPATTRVYVLFTMLVGGGHKSPCGSLKFFENI